VAAIDYMVPNNFKASPVNWPWATTACGIATSADGVTWTATRLPNTTSGWSSSQGLVRGIQFIKGKLREGEKGTGFFIAAGFEYRHPSPSTTVFQSKLWRSVDGIDWTLVRTTDNDVPLIISVINRSNGQVVFQ
jgi:hypothetical protein